MTATLKFLNAYLWVILSAQAQGEAEKKLDSRTESQGLCAYLKIHSGLTCSTDQGRGI